MDEFETEQEQEQETQRPPLGESSVIRDLRERAGKADAAEKAAEEARREAEEAKRQLALRDQIDGIGIPSEKRASFQKLASGLLEGELDEQALRGLATEYGFLAPEPERAAEGERIEQAATTHVGARTPAPDDADVIVKKMNEAKTPDEVIALAQQAGMPIADQG